MITREERWAELERLLTEALQSVIPSLAQKDRKLVAELIDHNEFGVARDWLLGALEEQDIPANDVAQAALARVGALMGTAAENPSLDITGPRDRWLFLPRRRIVT